MKSVFLFFIGMFFLSASTSGAAECDPKESRDIINKFTSQFGERISSNISADYYFSRGWYSLSYDVQRAIVEVLEQAESCVRKENGGYLQRLFIYMNGEKVAEYNSLRGIKIIKNRP